ncbi:unnamed protein product [Linum tenue]|uniref:Uncharacterized protein n=1 Tax=Linum tenue TaxID=586396 RepID=A0AAV0HK69_9ROSI|nr:unnamed protein product [Linum tenue]
MFEISYGELFLLLGATARSDRFQQSSVLRVYQQLPSPRFLAVSANLCVSYALKHAFKVYDSSIVFDSSNMHSQATAYVRLAESAAVEASLDPGQQIDDLGFLHILPVSAERTGMLPNRQGNNEWIRHFVGSYSRG